VALVKLADEEIEEGLVIYFDPEQLVRFGAVCTTWLGTPVIGSHYFVCTGVDTVAKTSEWVPLLSRSGATRSPIHPESKKGHPKFVEPTSYYAPYQYWRGPNSAFIKASWNEVTTRARRNRVSVEVVDEMVVEIEERGRRGQRTPGSDAEGSRGPDAR